MRTFGWITGGLLLGAIIHIVSVLILPSFASNNAWARLSKFGGYNSLYTLPAASPQVSAIADMDPSIRFAMCRYDISKGPLRVDAVIPQTYWALAVYDPAGSNFYSLNDRSARRSVLTLWVADQRQILNLEPVEGGEIEDRLVVKSNSSKGVILLRTLVPDASYEPTVRNAFAESRCQIDNSILTEEE